MKLRIILFLLASVFVWQSCQEQEFYPEKLLIPSEVNNEIAVFLLQQLQQQPDAYDEFVRVLESNQPFYEYVQVMTHPDYKLCYFIPYGREKIEGAVFYPVESEMMEDGKYSLRGKFGQPDKVDAWRLNHEIKITSRYLYSAQFKTLQDEGADVNPALVECAEQLSEHSVLVPEEESSFGVATRASGVLEVVLRYSESTYIGGKYDAVYGLDPQRIVDVTRYALKQMGVRENIMPEHRLYQMIWFCIPQTELHVEADYFFRNLIQLIESHIYQDGFVVHLQYEYKNWYTTGGGGGGGSSGTGGSSSGGGGGNTSSGGNTATSSTPLVNSIYAKTSTLTKSQRNLLEKALQDFIEMCPQYEEMFDELTISGLIKFEINPDLLAKGGGRAGYFDGVISFYDEKYIKVRFLQEELIHAIQERDVYSLDYMRNARKNVEFEAKVIQDIVDVMITGRGGGIGCMNESDEFKNNYMEWILVYSSSGIKEFVSRFNEFCEPWTEYGGTYQPNFRPRVIMKYFK